ncbi:winged helix-turn-helix domain-containing protein [Bradyrhizobium sp. BRP22]|uniref:ATP-binding protein n=1 Tax=Bradyrhizobium sp. BRP22 TaxID=2793821 RepID=UPI001CD5E42D|nr:winged helix-turn-helix domain-containing protein [Bradyrhizobium sp. BRP22]MCA1455635.1 winged helix-turn-helix domain-containing protein [Bradyrhizobium sp. BRP22]
MGDRMQRAVREAGADSAVPEAFSFGSFRLHVGQRRLEKDGNPIQLGGRALDLLIALVERAGKVVGKNELLATVWRDVIVDEGSLRVQIAGLRKALGDGEAGARYLTTVSGQGYCFIGRLSHSHGQEQPPIGPTSEPSHNLPARPIRMIGRDQTVRDISAKLRSERFVTIVGPGGVGKTTVAVSAGHELLEEFAGAVRFLDFGALQDPALVANVVASTLGLLSQSGDPSDSLVNLLRHKRMLLILDCCEHVIETSAALAERLHAEAPQLHILATSRESLRVEGEHVHRLQPLSSPPDDASLTAVQALAFPAVQLFVERAATSGGRLAELSDADARLVGGICRRLDGIALAIELAASHASAGNIKDTVALLNDAFKFLGEEGQRAVLPRHQTLRATLDWSYKLLSEPERVVLRRVSVFAGTFTLEAARSVAGTDGADDGKVIAAVASLVAKSMLVASASGMSTRYRLLDTARAYALERLAVSTDADATARRHACYFLHLLQGIGNSSTTSPELNSFAAIADQFGNIRAALTWCFSERGDRATGIALAAAAMPFFLKLSVFAECQLWARRAIEQLETTNHGQKYDLDLHAALGLALLLTKGTTDDVHACLTRALRLAEEIGDVPSQLRLIERLHVFQMRTGNFTDALALARRGEAVASDHGDRIRLAHMRIALGVSWHLAGDTTLARSHVESALLQLPGSEGDVDDPLNYDYLSRARITLARILWLQGYPDQAIDTAQRAIADTMRIGHPVKLCMALLWAFSIFVWNSETENYEEYADRLILEASKHALGPYQTIGYGTKGVVLVAQGQVETGIALLRGALEVMHSHRYGSLADFRIALAQALATIGEEKEALDTIDLAIARVGHNKDLFCMPELLRAKAEVLLAASRPDLMQAERYLKESIDLARRQSALAMELVAATHLARLWLRQGRAAEARQLLAPTYVRFTEGFNSRALKAARELLDELSSQHPCSSTEARLAIRGSARSA